MTSPNKLRALVFVVLGLLALSWLQASGPQQSGKDSADKDYAAELPRIPAKEPAEALKTFQIHPDFRLELVASEPLIRDPVAVAFDENGYLYVVEYPEYNQIDVPNFKERGCIKRLEDTDDDGKYDKATTYVDKLDAPTAVACWEGGVFVGAVPNILYCKDTDGDGQADLRKVVFTGFDRDKAGEAMMNSFRWLFDNRIHISTSLAGGNVRRADDKKSSAVSVRNRGFLFDPRSLQFELTTGGGQHGLSMDDWGREFVCSNSVPLITLMYDGRYIERNPYVQAPAAALSIDAEPRFHQLFRLSPNEPWRVVRTRLRSKGVVPGSAEAGRPSGFFTGATGITVYRGDAWPREYRGNLFVGDVANNLVYRALPVPSGVALLAKRADKSQEFLASTDIWFRPAQFANAPDGNLYVIDMYRELVETVVSIPPVISKHLDTTSGVQRGRIYRLIPKDAKLRPPPKLGQASTAELVALLEHPNGWHRDTASRLLYQRQDRGAVPRLKKLCTESKSPLGRLHALYALDGLQALTAEQVAAALDDSEPRLREQAVKLSEKFASHPQVQARLLALVKDPDMRVRYQLAFSLGEFRGEAALQALVQLARRDAADTWLRLAILTAARDRAGEVFRRLLAEEKQRHSPGGKLLLTALAHQIGAAQRTEDLAAFTRALEQLPAQEKTLGQDLMQQVLSKLPPAERVKIQQTGKSKELFADLLASAKKIALDEKQSAAQRAAVIPTLGLAELAQVQGLFRDLLQVRQPALVQKSALETLSRFEQPAVAPLVLAAWPTLSPLVRATAAETLFARPAWTTAFLDAVEKGTVKTSEIDPARISLLKASAEPALRQRAEKLFAGAGLSKRADIVASYRKALDLEGDAERGKGLFKQHCSTCHQLEGVGQAVGADLSAIRDRGNEVILLNVLDPNREVKPQFVNYLVVTDAGRTITGMITAESASSITLRRPDGTSETVLRVNIEELRSTGLSFMPEGLEQQINLQGMADLLAYLNRIGR